MKERKLSDPSVSEEETGNCDFLQPSDISDLVQDVQDLCRLCMSSKKINTDLDMVAISDKCPNTDTPVSLIIAESLSIVVNDSPSLYMPNKVCVKCLEKLNSFSSFKKHSLKVDSKLRQIVSRKEKLAEAQALYGAAFNDADTPPHYLVDTSTSPVYFDSNDECVSNICLTSFQAVQDNVNDLLNIEHKLPSCLDIDEIEASLNEESGGMTEPQAGYKKTKLPDQDKKTVGVDKILYSGHKEIKTASDAAEVSLVDDVTKTVLGDHEGSNNCKTKGNVQVAIQCDQVCLSEDVIEEVVVSESVSCKEDASASDFVPDEKHQGDHYDFKVSNCKPSNDTRKHDRIPILVPELFVLKDENAVKRLAFRCRICRKLFKSQNLFRKHAAGHGKLKGGVCKHCDKWFPTRHALIRHERVHSGEKPFQCILCDRSFSQREILQRHILTHTDTKPFQCKQCDKNYAQKSGLINHVRHNHRPASKISLYPCPLCSKAFCHPSGLSRHMLAHTGKQYVCKFCNHKFSDSSALRRHSKNKHGSLP